jgi:nucleotide-binding universal stress UspA family protein
MSEIPNPIPVVVAYDFSPSSEFALGRAVEVAARAPQHVLHIITVLDPHEHATIDTADHVSKTLIAHATAAFAGRPTASEVQFFVHARIGQPTTEILELAREVGADMIFIGSHNKTGLERFLLGSVSEHVVREAGCPVMVVRPKSYQDVKLLPITRYEHERAPHKEPHCYSYKSERVLLRPADWPIM